MESSHQLVEPFDSENGYRSSLLDRYKYCTVLSEMSNSKSHQLTASEELSFWPALEGISTFASEDEGRGGRNQHGA